MFFNFEPNFIEKFLWESFVPKFLWESTQKWMGPSGPPLCTNGSEKKLRHLSVKRKAPSFSNFDLNGHFYEYGWSDFLRTFTN